MADFRRIMHDCMWEDGRSTAGAQSALVKSNQQLPPDSEVARKLGNRIVSLLTSNPRFISAAIPLLIFPPLFNRYAAADAHLVDLAAAAGAAALADAGLDGALVDLVVVASCSQDSVMPNAAPQVAYALGAAMMAAGVALVAVVLPAVTDGRREHFDLLGWVLLAGAIVALSVALSEGGPWGWTSPGVVVLLAKDIGFGQQILIIG